MHISLKLPVVEQQNVIRTPNLHDMQANVAETLITACKRVEHTPEIVAQVAMHAQDTYNFPRLVRVFYFSFVIFDLCGFVWERRVTEWCLKEDSLCNSFVSHHMIHMQDLLPLITVQAEQLICEFTATSPAMYSKEPEGQHPGMKQPGAKNLSDMLVCMAESKSLAKVGGAFLTQTHTQNASFD